MSDLTPRYATAESLLAANLKKLIDSPRVTPVWIGDTDTFWYRNSTAKGNEFIFVDATTGEKRPAFDHERMADAVRALIPEEVPIPVEPYALPFPAIEFHDNAVRVAVLTKIVEVSLDTYEVKELGELRTAEVESPDGRYAVSVKEHNLYIRDTETNEERQLTTDGVEYYDYGSFTGGCSNLVMKENLGIDFPPLVSWSPDSKRFVTHRLDQRDTPLMHLVRSAPADGGRPKLLSYPYSLVGDEKFATAEFLVFDAATGAATAAKHAPIDTPFVPTIGYGFLWWSDDSTKAFWLSQDRGDRTGWLHELNPGTGDVRVLYTETTESHILYGPQQFHRNIRVLKSGEVLWWSQRTDYAHLYLVSADGSTVSPLTEGDWNVRHVISLDEDARTVIFTGAGWAPGSDPYMQQLFSVSLDTGALTALTSDDLDHDAMVMSMPLVSKSGRYFVDVVSRYDTPTVSVLRNRAGDAVLELERADATKLYEAGWSPAERVVVKAADGETDIYCAIYKPFDFDPTKKYPVVDETYPGPQNSCAPLRFPLAGGEMVGEWSCAQFAALGFVAVVVDGRGSALRTKSFQDYSRQPGDLFVADNVAAIKQLAETRPWMDLDRVGIYGESRGGYAAMKAMLLEPDFFKVAVSTCGDHDDRVNHAWWGEKFFGLADEFDYVQHTNNSHVENLKGKVLIAHGEMDDNCLPHNTTRLVDALIKANKDFDLLLMPNLNHGGIAKSGYWLRRRWDYFVQHLLDETPPAYSVPDQPMMPS